MIILCQAAPTGVGHEAIAAYIAVGMALMGLITSIIALVVAGRANNLNKNIAKRQGVIDLHFAWRDINEINDAELVGPDVSKAVSALDLTASLWNHDIIERVILHQSYWSPFQTLYETLKNCKSIVPGYNRRACDFIGREIDRAYTEMKELSISDVKQTKI